MTRPSPSTSTWLFVVGTLLAASSESTGQTTRVSVASNGAQSDAASDSAAISLDGRFVAFESSATNLVPGDTNGVADVFVHDRATGHTTRVSISSAGAQSPEHSTSPAISGDGRYVAFVSRASSLVSGDTACMVPGCSNVYLHDRLTGQVTLVSVSVDGTPPNGSSSSPTVSGDGRVVAFVSNASNMTAVDLNGPRSDVFLRDVRLGSTINVTGLAPPLLSAPPVVAPAFGAWGPSLSADGRFVAFASDAGELVVGDSNANCQVEYVGTGNCVDVFVYDRALATIVRASVNSQGAQMFYGGYAPSLSADGRVVTFLSPSADPDAATGFQCIVRGASTVYARDLQTGTTAVISTSGGNCASSRNHASVSADGRFVSFTRLAQVAGERHQSVVADRLSGAERRSNLSGVSGEPSGGVGYLGSYALGLSRDGRYALFTSSASNLVAGDTNQCVPGTDPGTCPDVFVRDMFDDDGDTMTNDWETFFGLNPASAADATLDSDADGQTNAEEFAAGTHPTGLGYYTRYFAEGAATDFFDTRIAVANPNPTAWASVLLRFVKADGSFVTRLVAIPPERTYQLLTDTLPELAGSAFSTAVETDVQVVADRLMWWGPSGAYGTHAERSLAGLSNTWYFAEGATHSGFDLFFLVLNPNATSSSIRARYLLPNGSTLERTYVVPARSRFNIWVDQELFGGVAALANTDVATVFEVQNGVPVMVERAMYLTTPGGPMFGAGHASAGSTTTQHRWFFGEGATGPYFDEYLLVVNPSTSATTVRVNYLLESGMAYSKTYVVGPRSRFTIWVDDETIPGQGKVLADVALSIRVDVLNGDGVVAERSMWWPGPTSATWHEAHNVLGSPTSSRSWGFAEGAVSDGPNPVDTYFLIGNDEARPSTVRVRLLFADATPPVSKIVTVGPRSRLNFNVRQEFPAVTNRQFGAVVESVDFVPVPIVVERAVYNDANGVHWAAGTAALGTPIP